MERPTELEERVQRAEADVADLRQRLLQAQKMSSVGALASSITHEFNNVLTTVINYAKMGLRHSDDAVREKAFDKILGAGQRAAKITTGLLSYARNNGARRERVDLVELVQDVLVLVEKDLQMHRVRLELDLASHPQAELNVNQVQQVVLNLVVNARQAMEGGGRMRVSVHENLAERMAEIAVRDTGCGIPAEQLPRIFKAFYSTKTPDAGGQGGTGLGLSLCREIVEEHGGRIRVESAVGCGTTFTLKFPLATSTVHAVPKAG